MTPKYVNPYTDFGFKKLFGQEANKDLLIDFLNAILPERHRVRSLTFRNPENLPDIQVARRAVFDIFCESESGEKFIVEMQKSEQHYFKDRSLFYSTFPIREQAPRGGWNFQLKAVYFIAILDFEYDEEEERRKFLREVSLRDQDGDKFYDKLHFIFLQMPLFDKKESQLESHKDKWFYFLKNLVTFDQIPAILHEPVFERAFETAELARMSREEQAIHVAEQMAYWDNYAVVQTAEDKGREEGREEEKTEIARNMLKDGLDVKTISKYTGLSTSDIERLR